MQRLFDAITRAQGEFNCTDDDLDGWLDGKVADVFKKVGVLVRQETAASIDCPGCGSHMVNPVFSGVKNNIRNYVITCDDPAVGTFDFQGDLYRYRVDLEKLAQLIAVGLGLTGNVHERTPGQLFELGFKKTSHGNTRCFILLSDTIERHKQLFEESTKSAYAVIFCGSATIASFIDRVTMLNITELLSVSENKLNIDQTLFKQTVESLFGANYYENGMLYACGELITKITPGTKLDIVLKYLTAPAHIDRPVPNADTLRHYNNIKGSKITGADQWCYQTLSELRVKCEEKSHLVDMLIQKGGKENTENSLIFRSKT